MKKTISLKKALVFITAAAALIIVYLSVKFILAGFDTIQIRGIFSEEIKYIEKTICEENIEESVTELVSGKIGQIGSKDSKRINLEMNSIYVNKGNCVDLAKMLLRDGLIKGMSVKDLAAEIYTHASVYYVFEAIPSFIHKLPGFSSVYRSVSNGIDLEDGGDTHTRQLVYAVVYKLF